MTPSMRRFLISSLVVGGLLTGGAVPVLARSGHGSGGTSTSGDDISWPQCGGSFPTGQAFGIVGLNGGLANNLNPCLASELTWASQSSGATTLPRAAIYVNTADPGQVVPAVADWPTNDVDPSGASEAPGTANADPYGACAGADDRACSWQYGWNRAVQDTMWLRSLTGSGFRTVPSAYEWWLDVETGNTWETGTANLPKNVADLEGMVAALRSVGGVATVGVYSTSSQWAAITSGGGGSAVLAGLPDWIPGARTQSAAQANCSLPAFTGGTVLVAQWFGRFDGDVSCLG